MQVNVSTAELPPMRGPRGNIPGRSLLEGAQFGLANLTLVLGESPPGQRIGRHHHDYEGIFIVHAGRGTYTVGDSTIEAGPGDVILIPANVPHFFANNGPEPLVHTAVMAAGRTVGVQDD